MKNSGDAAAGAGRGDVLERLDDRAAALLEAPDAVERTDLRREHLVGAEGQAHQRDRRIESALAQGQQQVIGLELAVDAPAEGAAGLDRRALLEKLAQQIGEIGEIRTHRLVEITPG